MINISTRSTWEDIQIFQRYEISRTNKVVDFKKILRQFCQLCISSCELEDKLEIFHDKFNQSPQRISLGMEYRQGFEGHVAFTALSGRDVTSFENYD